MVSSGYSLRKRQKTNHHTEKVSQVSFLNSFWLRWSSLITFWTTATSYRHHIPNRELLTTEEVYKIYCDRSLWGVRRPPRDTVWDHGTRHLPERQSSTEKKRGQIVKRWSSIFHSHQDGNVHVFQFYTIYIVLYMWYHHKITYISRNTMTSWHHVMYIIIWLKIDKESGSGNSDPENEGLSSDENSEGEGPDDSRSAADGDDIINVDEVRIVDRDHLRKSTRNPSKFTKILNIFLDRTNTICRRDHEISRSIVQ